jgi:hypothetical protein
MNFETQLLALLSKYYHQVPEDVASAVRAYIAEWDEAHRLSAESGKENITLTDRLRIVGDALDEAQHDRDDLRKRVQALERNLNDAQMDNAENAEEARQFEARLAAIRQRAVDMRTLVAVVKPEVAAALMNMGVSGEVSQEVVGALAVAAVASARYVLGEDESAPSAPQTDDLAAVEQWRENQEARATPSPGAPTTAEEIAMVERGLGGDVGINEREEARVALSLLERHMGALVRAGRDLLRMTTEGVSLDQSAERWRALEAALTDSPEVWTREEVEKAALLYFGRTERDRIAVGAMLERLDAMLERARDALAASVMRMRKGTP